MTYAQLMPFLFGPDATPSSIVKVSAAVHCLGQPLRDVQVDGQQVVFVLGGEPDSTLDARALADALRGSEEEAVLLARGPGESEPKLVPDSRGIRLHTSHRGVLTLDIGASVPR